MHAQDPRDPEVVCPDCREPVFFIDGIVGRERWRHVRTGEWRCDPRCKDCGEPASHRIGGDKFVGSGVRFVTAYHLCDACYRKPGRMFIERT